jgi:hypothetical protein
MTCLAWMARRNSSITWASKGENNDYTNLVNAPYTTCGVLPFGPETVVRSFVRTRLCGPRRF